MLDFAAKRREAGGDPESVNLWHNHARGVASYVDAMGFEDEALEMYERALQGPPDVQYLGRAMISHEVSRLELLMRMNRPVPDIVPRLEELLVRSKANIYISENGFQKTEVVLAKALIHTGREQEGLALLETLIGKGTQNARFARLDHWIKIGRVEGVEAELMELLKKSRESGHKSSEISLYATYADFLEATGRYQEALAMRLEVLRLNLAFDYYTRRPLQLAKLAVLLERLGDAGGSKTAQAEALEGLRQEGFPSGPAEETRKKLGELGQELGQKTAGVAVVPKVTPAVDFQPTRSVAVPLKGAAWFSLFTLSNPSGKVEEGTLSATGMPVTIDGTENGPTDVSVMLGAANGADRLPLRLEPGEYQLIAVSSAGEVEGKANLIWTPGSGGKAIHCEVAVEAADDGVSSAVVQAGQFIDNPFYGVPIHHYYVTKEPKEDSEPFRFVASATARVEIHDMEGKLLAIDSQGNGSLHDKGDELFVKSDGEGHVLLPLTKGACPFMVRIYPEKALPEEGLSLRIESLVNANWTPHAEDRLMP